MNDELLKRITDKAKASRPVKEKETWVKVGFIQELTGWKREKLRMARKQGLLKHKKDASGIWYLLQSIPEQFIKKQNHE